MAKRAKNGKYGKRYTAAQKAYVLATAMKEGLTGPQAAKKFGISLLTFYRWRGPVRARKRGPGRPRGSARAQVNVAELRRRVRAEIKKMLPAIIREEIESALR